MTKNILTITIMMIHILHHGHDDNRCHDEEKQDDYQSLSLSLYSR